jgi:hypothetical protein
MSNIDPTKPVEGDPTTQSVRDNFAAAKAEIGALQTPAIATPGIVAGTLVLDVTTGGVFRVNFSANIVALSLAGVPAGGVTTRQLELIADGTARTVNWGAWTLVTGAPVPTSAAGRKDVYELRADGSRVLVWLTAQNVPA